MRSAAANSVRWSGDRTLSGSVRSRDHFDPEVNSAPNGAAPWIHTA